MTDHFDGGFLRDDQGALIISGPALGLVATKLVLPNVTITDEANGVVNAMQLGEDGPAPKDQHLSTADRVGANGSGAGMTVNPGAAEGTNQAGAPLRLGSGISTGNSGSGAVVILTSTAGGAGAQQNTQADAWYFWGSDLSRALTPAAQDAQDIGYPSLRIRDIYAGAIKLREGTDASSGLATLVAGTVTVNTAKVTANSRIYLTVQTAGGTQGFLRIASRVNGVSFTITSTSGTETSTVAWKIVEPA